VENILSYRIGHPERPVLPLERIRAVGLARVEISLGADDDAGEARELLAAHGLAAATLSAPCPLADESVFEVFENYSAKGAALGCTSLFTSARAGELPLQVAYDRLRRLGEIAAAHGLKVGLETHPDLCENGAKAAATMAEINHPAVGVNYDTANVYYYNHGVDTVEEVAKVARDVVSVHLKDTLGGYRDARFPRFGEGVVDFAGVFRVLNEVGFHGPFTIELEGPLTHGDTPEEREEHVRACIAHLRSLGLVG